MKYPKLLTPLILLFCLVFFTEGQAQPPCTFTYEQGVTVGCQIAQAANQNGCYSKRCASAFSSTIEDFQSACPEYVSGVIAGFDACNILPPWRNNVTNDPLNTGNNIIDPPCENAVYTNGNWNCP